MDIARTLGSFVYKVSYDDLPQDVVTSTKDRILDFIGTAFNSTYRCPGGKESAMQRLCCIQEDLCSMPPKRAVYEEQVGSDD